jgi:polysaccharide deacetylase 2 family uncharacterized protein YibQ
MSTSSTRGGGFSVGVAYGLIASIALYLVLSLLFPIQTGMAPAGSTETAAVSAAPVVADTRGPAVAAPAVEGQPTGADVAVPEMAAPDVGGNDTVTLGEARDSAPAVAVPAAQIAQAPAVSAPDVATESASVPDIGNAALPGAVNSVAPGAENSASADAPAAESVTGTVAAAPSGLADTASGPAIEVFASAFSGDRSRPMLAIVLQDTREVSLQPLIDSGVPLTFAVDAGVDSRITAQTIRKAGFEVVARVPDGLNRTGPVAENMARFMQNVPVAVAMLDSQDPALMLDRGSMQAVIDATAPSGLGLITYSRNGELVARAQAEKAGVLFGSALQISVKIQDEELIIQALNQAAFVAGTNGRAIIFSKTKPATINALMRWFDSARASQIELVPVSVALQHPAN